MENKRKTYPYGFILVVIAAMIIGLLMWGIGMKSNHYIPVMHEDISADKDRPDTCLVFRDKGEKIVYIRKLK
jgi:hypothetical protein